jgi:peroxiredoxin Q/BCP
MTSAPTFHLPDQAGKFHSLEDYASKWLLLYFYPQDDTPGCTIEACAFRDDYDVLQAKGLTIVGMSGDSVESHAKFAEKYHLNFTILADESGDVIKAYDAKGLLGTKRMSFLINPSGEIAKEYPKVTPQGHSAEIMADLDALQKTSA